MNILIDVGHPAHIHLFRNAARIWIEHGHSVMFAARDRHLLSELINRHGFSHRIVSKARKGFFGLAFELLEHDWNLLKLAIDFKADILIGTSICITHVAKLLSKRSVIFNEDDIDYLKSFAILGYPFANHIVTPLCLRDKKTSKYINYEGYHELAYLHPNHFHPDPSIFQQLGIEPNESYFVLRFVELKAHHDNGKQGLSKQTKRELIHLLSNYGKVFISSEGIIDDDMKAYLLPTEAESIHHVLHYATMVISDSQTMTIEAAVLGTPAIRFNSFVGLCSVIEELEHKYGLTYGFTPGQEAEFFEKIKALISQPNLKEIWKQRKAKMLDDKIDLTAWMVNLIESENYRYHT